MIVNHVSKTAKIGKNVKIWHFSHIGDNVEIGDNVKIGSLAHIDYDVKVGSGTKIECFSSLSPGTKIGKNVFIGPGAVLTNDPYPMCDKMSGITVGDNVVIAAHAVINAGLTIGKNSVIAMGSVVIRDVPENVVVAGTPAKVKFTREEYDRKKQNWVESD